MSASTGRRAEQRRAHATDEAQNDPDGPVDGAVKAVDEVLEREERAGHAAHDEDRGRPRVPGDGEEEHHERAHGREQAERRHAAREAEEEVSVVHVQREPLCGLGVSAAGRAG